MAWALRRSEKAIDDLSAIHDYIAADNAPAADRLVRELLVLFDRTALHPQLGRPADEIGEGVRILTRGSYLIIYQLHESEEAVELIRVVHGARDWKALFDA